MLTLFIILGSLRAEASCEEIFADGYSASFLHQIADATGLRWNQGRSEHVTFHADPDDPLKNIFYIELSGDRLKAQFRSGEEHFAQIHLREIERRFPAVKVGYFIPRDIDIDDTKRLLKLSRSMKDAPRKLGVMMALLNEYLSQEWLTLTLHREKMSATAWREAVLSFLESVTNLRKLED